MATPTTLPAAFVAGQVLTAAEQNALRGAFRVLQVVQATNATTTTISTNAYTSIGPLSATITPSATSSKILVFATVGAILKENNTWAGVQLFRGATGVFTAGDYVSYNGATQANGSSASLMYLDSPATVSATTYEIKVASRNNASYVQVNAGATNSIILMEISA